MTQDDSHVAYRRSVEEVEVAVIATTSPEISITSRKNLSRGLTSAGFIEYHNTLYGDAARGCHHRGNRPDARERTIWISRQRLGVLIKGPRRNPRVCNRVHLWEKEVTHRWLRRRRLRRSRPPRRPPRSPRRRSKKLLFNRFVSPVRAGVLWSPGSFISGRAVLSIDGQRGGEAVEDFHHAPAAQIRKSLLVRQGTCCPNIRSI
jgi:hypothetical protein